VRSFELASSSRPLPLLPPRPLLPPLLLLLLVAGGASPTRGQDLRHFPAWESWLAGSIPAEPAWDLSAEPATLASPFLGAQRSLAVPPLGPPEGRAIFATGELALLLRERRPEREHEYRRTDLSCGYRWRQRTRWAWLRLRGEGVLLRQRNVYTDDDRMRAERDGDGWQVGVGRQWRAWSVQLSGGRQRSWEGGLAIAHTGRWGSAVVSGCLNRPDWYLDQAFADRRYRFLFPYRRERLVAVIAPRAHWLPRLSGLREVAKGEPDRSSGDYNTLYLLRHGVGIAWPHLPGGAALAASWEEGRLDLRMVADGALYARLSELDLRHFGLGARSPVGPLGLQLVGEARRHRAEADDGFFEPWPFYFWDVFENNRYELQALDYRLDLWAIGLTRRFGVAPATAGSGPGASPANSLRITVQHGWLSGGGEVRWRERVPMLWPFLFRWEPHDKPLELPATRILQVEAAADLRLARPLALHVEVLQIVPLSGADESAPEGGGPEPGEPAAGQVARSWTYGGLRTKVGLEWRLP
jgi:hypothetical protein